MAIITGTSGDDTLTGTAQADTITGGAGADHMSGKGGDDTFIFFADDVAVGETMDGGAGIDNLSIASGALVDFSGAASILRMEGITFVDSGGAAIFDAAQITAGLSPSAMITGSAGSDSITINNASNLTLSGWLFTGTIENLMINGTSSNDTVVGSKIEDTIQAGAGDDTLNGAGGNDTVDGGQGNDILNGGAGSDTARYGGGAPTGAFVNLSNAAQTRDYNGTPTTVAAGHALDGWGTTDTLSSIERVEGSSFNDVIIGNAADNMFTGFGGDDSMEGRAGVDTYVWSAGDGNDTIVATGSGSTSEDVISINGTFYDYHWEADGNDLLIGVTADDSYTFNTGGSLRLHDFFVGGDSVAYLEADLGPLNQKYYSHPEGTNARIYVSAVNGGNQGDAFEVILGTDNADTMTSGGGRDDDFWGRGGNDVMSVSGNTMGRFHGDSGDDTITGGNNNDRMRGDEGNDILNGGAGSDTARYGGGAPTGAFVNLSNAAQTRDYNGTPTTVAAGHALDGWGTTDTLSSIERVEGSSFNDVIIGNAADNMFTGFGGDDSMEGRAGVDTYVWSAGDGNDTIVATGSGSTSEDVISINGTFYDYHWEADGNDLLIGVTADDSYTFNTGGSLRLHDFFVGGDSVAYLEADLGPLNQKYYSHPEGTNARIYVSAVNGGNQGDAFEVILGTDNADTMTSGGGRDDDFWGRGGNDVMSVSGNTMGRFHGDSGDDTITGGNNNDRMRGDEGNDILNGGAGSDTARYGGGAPTGAFVNLSNAAQTRDYNGTPTTVAAGHALDGWGTTDTLSSIERVEGSSFNDVIIGNAADNMFTGFGGDDSMEGRAGSDTFVFASGSGNDLIADFQTGTSGDILDLVAFGFANDAEAISHATDQGNDILFDFGTGDTLLVQHHHVADLAAENILT